MALRHLLIAEKEVGRRDSQPLPTAPGGELATMENRYCNFFFFRTDHDSMVTFLFPC